MPHDYHFIGHGGPGNALTLSRKLFFVLQGLLVIAAGLPTTCQVCHENPEAANAPLSLAEPVSVLPRHSDVDACRSLAVVSVPFRSLDDSQRDLERKQRLGSASLLCTVPASECERTTLTMINDAEKTLTDTDKGGAFGASFDTNATSLPITAHNNDQQLGEGMDEDFHYF
ncbi:hypothetical protein MRX96_020807 [Rhipicephalus microplus]